MHQRLDVKENEKEEDVRRRLDNELEVSSWWVPWGLRPEEREPRVTEDGLSIPDWWTDEETESQTWLISQGVEL